MTTLRSAATMVIAAIVASGCVYLDRISVTAGGVQWSDASVLLDVSADGRYVLFRTEAAVAPSDINGTWDIYRKDTLTGGVMHVSRRGLVGGTDASMEGEMSDDGRWIAYASTSSNLVPVDINNVSDVYLFDADDDTVTRASVDDSGLQFFSPSTMPAISGDGRYTAFVTRGEAVAADTNGDLDVYRYDRVTGTVELVSSTTFGVVGNDDSRNPSLDFDGSIVVFESAATNLVPNDTNNDDDIFGKFQAGLTVRVSVAAAGAQANSGSTDPSVAGNGLAVAFESTATNLVPSDLNGLQDIFVKTITGPVFLASLADDDVTQASQISFDPRMNGDGTVVVFSTVAPELTGGTGVLASIVRDGLVNRTEVASLGASGDLVGAAGPVISADGNYVGFSSGDLDVITPDANGFVSDVFLRYWSEHEVTAITPSTISLGATQPVTITGSGFSRLADLDVYTNVSGADGISFTNIVVVDENTITADVTSTVGTTALGTTSLWVQAIGGGPGPTSGALDGCVDCVTVAP